MTNPFKNPIKPAKKENGEKEWSFKAPSYDNRTSCSIPGGDDYGNGFRTPVGKEKASGKNVAVKAGSVTKKQIEEIAARKLPDLNTTNLAAATRIIAGTARSMGIEVK